MMKVLLALSPSNLRGASSKVNVIKRKERSVVKFLITPYKELNDHLNNSKSSRGKITEWEKIFSLILKIAERLVLKVSRV